MSQYFSRVGWPFSNLLHTSRNPSLTSSGALRQLYPNLARSLLRANTSSVGADLAADGVERKQDCGVSVLSGVAFAEAGCGGVNDASPRIAGSMTNFGADLRSLGSPRAFGCAFVFAFGGADTCTLQSSIEDSRCKPGVQRLHVHASSK